MSDSHRIRLRLSCSLVAALCAAGCGQKGPLYLPGDAGEVRTDIPRTELPSPEEAAEDEEAAEGQAGRNQAGDNQAAHNADHNADHNNEQQ